MFNGNFFHDLFIVLSLFIIFEGILPFLDPFRWKNYISFFLKKSDNFIRVVGLFSMIIGVILLYLIK